MCVLLGLGLGLGLGLSEKCVFFSKRKGSILTKYKSKTRKSLRPTAHVVFKRDVLRHFGTKKLIIPQNFEFNGVLSVDRLATISPILVVNNHCYDSQSIK